MGLRNVVRKGYYKLKEINKQKVLTSTLSKKYYFVPLQTHNDFQITQHSKYQNIEAFISEVLNSFANYAPKDTFIVIKHHPMDRGRKNYIKFINTLSKKLDINHRVMVIYDLHLPTCLKNAKATITINSTVGISSLFHQIPTLTLGEAIYDIKGLIEKSTPLDDFWNNHTPPNNELFTKFRNYLVKHTQLNGSFYGRFPVEFETDEIYKQT